MTEEDILANMQCTETPYDEDEKEDEDGNRFIENRACATTDARTELRRFFLHLAHLRWMMYSPALQNMNLHCLKMSTITRHPFMTFSSNCLYFIAIYHCPHYDFYRLTRIIR